MGIRSSRRATRVDLTGESNSRGTGNSRRGVASKTREEETRFGQKGATMVSLTRKIKNQGTGNNLRSSRRATMVDLTGKSNSRGTGNSRKGVASKTREEDTRFGQNCATMVSLTKKIKNQGTGNNLRSIPRRVASNTREKKISYGPDTLFEKDCVTPPPTSIKGPALTLMKHNNPSSHSNPSLVLSSNTSHDDLLCGPDQSPDDMEAGCRSEGAVETTLTPSRYTLEPYIEPSKDESEGATPHFNEKEFAKTNVTESQDVKNLKEKVGQPEEQLGVSKTIQEMQEELIKLRNENEALKKEKSEWMNSQIYPPTRCRLMNDPPPFVYPNAYMPPGAYPQPGNFPNQPRPLNKLSPRLTQPSNQPRAKFRVTRSPSVSPPPHLSEYSPPVREKPNESLLYENLSSPDELHIQFYKQNLPCEDFDLACLHENLSHSDHFQKKTSSTHISSRKEGSTDESKLLESVPDYDELGRQPPRRVNVLEENLDDEIRQINEDLTTNSSKQMTDVHVPHDPNFTCPHCSKVFRNNQLQKFKVHVKECELTRDNSCLPSDLGPVDKLAGAKQMSTSTSQEPRSRLAGQGGDPNTPVTSGKEGSEDESETLESKFEANKLGTRRAWKVSVLEENLDDEIRQINEDLTTNSSKQMTDVHVPHDPNFTCPHCSKVFRNNQLQKFKVHVKECELAKQMSGDTQPFSIQGSFPVPNHPSTSSNEATPSEFTARLHEGSHGNSDHDRPVPVHPTPQPTPNVLPRQCTPSPVPLPRRRTPPPSPLPRQRTLRPSLLPRKCTPSPVPLPI